MSDQALLAGAFMAHLDGALRDAATAEATLPARLDELVAAAREAWPGIELAPRQFVARVAERLSGQPSVASELAQVRAADMYLACACALGDRAALVEFERGYLPAVDAALIRMRAGGDNVDEVRQLVRHKLLVAVPPGEPKIADYAGRGSLRNWVRATAVRTYFNLLRKHKRELAPEDDRMLDALPDVADDPELAHLKNTYRDELKAAFEAALAELTDREVNVLRHYFVDDLTIDQIGALYRCHRVTAFRWVDRARDKLARRTRKRLQGRLQVSHTELDSIMRLVQSQLDLSIARCLGASDPTD